MESNAVVRLCSADLLAQRNLQTTFDWEMKSHHKRIFLIDRDDLENLLILVGIVSFRRDFRRVVNRDTLDFLNNDFNSNFSQIWEHYSEDIIPSDISLPEFGRNFDLKLLRDACRDAGMSQLLGYFEPVAEKACAGRALYLTHNRFDVTTIPAIPDANRKRSLNAILDHILPRCAPKWTWLF